MRVSDGQEDSFKKSSWVRMFQDMDPSYYRQELPKKQRVAVRVLYIVCYLAAAALFILGSVLRPDAGSAWYLAVSEAVVMVELIWMLGILISYIPAAQELTAAEHNRTSFALRRCSLFTCICAALASLAGFWRCIELRAVSGGLPVGSALLLASAVPVLVIYLTERSILYTPISGRAEEHDVW